MDQIRDDTGPWVCRLPMCDFEVQLTYDSTLGVSHCCRVTIFSSSVDDDVDQWSCSSCFLFLVFFFLEKKGEIEQEDDEPKIFLGALNVAKTTTELVDTIFKTTGLFGYACGFGRCNRSRFVFDHDIKVHKLFAKGWHIVVETEGVLSYMCSCKDIISLSFLFSLHHNRIRWIGDCPVNVKRTTGLDRKIESNLVSSRFIYIRNISKNSSVCSTCWFWQTIV